jgi:hypothetical protein
MSIFQIFDCPGFIYTISIAKKMERETPTATTSLHNIFNRLWYEQDIQKLLHHLQKKNIQLIRNSWKIDFRHHNIAYTIYQNGDQDVYEMIEKKTFYIELNASKDPVFIINMEKRKPCENNPIKLVSEQQDVYHQKKHINVFNLDNIFFLYVEKYEENRYSIFIQTHEFIPHMVESWITCLYNVLLS